MPRRGIIAIVAVALIGAAIPVCIAIGAWQDGLRGFPLDDAWIHLTYARNLAEHGALAYSPGAERTAGSTSPLFMLSLAGAFLLSRSGELVGHALSLLCHLGFLLALGLWAARRLGSPLLAALVVLLVALDGRAIILAASGMETPLFMATVALALYGRAAARPLLCGAAAGASLWARPEGLLLVLVLACDVLLDRLRERSEDAAPVLPPRAWLRGAGVAAGMLLLYFAYHLAVGGALFPTTLQAKTSYYAPASAARFLGHEVPRALFADGWVLLAPLAVVGLAREALRLLRRAPAGPSAEAGWGVALVSAYAAMLPFSHLFNRYLLPALPALAVIAVVALRDLATRFTEGRTRFVAWSPPGVAAIGLLCGVAFWQLHVVPVAREHYRERCAYHARRQERAGRWLSAHTPADAVIATHDIGAIGYLAGRRIVDVAGIATPEVSPHLHAQDYTAALARLFARERVTHLAVLRNWLEVDNVPPLFVADPAPELLEVYRWQPGRTHLVPMAASRLRREAQGLLQARDPAAIPLLQRALAHDPRGARGWYLLGIALQAAGDRPAAAGAFDRALASFPDFAAARAARQRLSARPRGAGPAFGPTGDRLP